MTLDTKLKLVFIFLLGCAILFLAFKVREMTDVLVSVDWQLERIHQQKGQ